MISFVTMHPTFTSNFSGVFLSDIMYQLKLIFNWRILNQKPYSALQLMKASLKFDTQTNFNVFRKIEITPCILSDPCDKMNLDPRSTLLRCTRIRSNAVLQMMWADVLGASPPVPGEPGGCVSTTSGTVGLSWTCLSFISRCHSWPELM